MRVAVDVCDVCQDLHRQVTYYQVSADGRKGGTWRCDEHGTEFEQILAGEGEEQEPTPKTVRLRSVPAQPAATAATPGRRPRVKRQARVATMDQVAAARLQR
jgi:hypothetical protein